MLRTFERTFEGALLVLLMAVVWGCASVESTSQATAGPPANAAGSWSGYAGVGAASAPVSLTLTQTGASVNGNLSVGGSPDLTGSVTGSVQGNMLTLQMQNGRSVTPMTVGPDQITGVLSVGPVTLRRVR